MKYKIFDTHAHYNDEAFNEDREELLSGLFERNEPNGPGSCMEQAETMGENGQRAKRDERNEMSNLENCRRQEEGAMGENGVCTVVEVSAEFGNIPNVLKLAARYDSIYAAVGVHPTEVYNLKDSDIKAVEEYALLGVRHPAATLSSGAEGNVRTLKISSSVSCLSSGAERNVSPVNKVVAIGEIGLDYHYPDTDKEKQKKWFAMQIDLAKRLSLPIIVHSRDAAKDTLDIIRAEGARDIGGVIHCFSYEPEMSKLYTDMGFYIGIGGVVTFKKARKLKEIAKQMPMELMLLETDCPYLAPEPFRGRRNNSSLINYVAEEIAALRGMKKEEVVRITAENARRFYRL